MEARQVNTAKNSTTATQPRSASAGRFFHESAVIPLSAHQLTPVDVERIVSKQKLHVGAPQSACPCVASESPKRPSDTITAFQPLRGSTSMTMMVPASLDK
jgi:hypothetical protein